jgi:hypothetical protein
VLPEEDQFVLPFLQGNGYGFVGLKGGKDVAQKTYKVFGSPTNLLLDEQGRIIFRPRVHDAESQMSLELEIESLLAHASPQVSGVH